jgi:hypothetical protein
MSMDDYARMLRTSEAFILNCPDYYAFFTYSLFRAAPRLMQGATHATPKRDYPLEAPEPLGPGATLPAFPLLFRAILRLIGIQHFMRMKRRSAQSRLFHPKPAVTVGKTGLRRR